MRVLLKGFGRSAGRSEDSPHDINALLVINNINTIFRYYISNFLKNIHQVIAEIYLISLENVTVLIHQKRI